MESTLEDLIQHVISLNITANPKAIEVFIYFYT
jgi:hypothetical protein